MNGFKVLAVGAFLYCGPSFCFGQINILDDRSGPRSILVGTSDELLVPAPAADLTRESLASPEISTQSEAEGLLAPADEPSSILVDAPAPTPPAADPSSLPVRTHGHHNPVDQILRNGLIAQTPHCNEVPVSWPSRQVDNPTARMMMASGCTQGLWDSYAAERAAQCAHMYSHLAGHQHHHACGAGACNSVGHGCATCAQPVNRYAPSACDQVSRAAMPGVRAATNYRSLLAPTSVAEARPLNDRSLNVVPETKDNIAQVPGLIR